MVLNLKSYIFFITVIFLFRLSTVSAYAQNHPRYLLNDANLKSASKHVVNGKAAEVYQSLSRSPGNSTEMVEAAFVYQLEKYSGRDGNSAGLAAKNYLLKYVRNSSNVPSTVFLKYSVKTWVGWDSLPIGIAYDWLYPLLSSSEQQEVRNYLNQWITTLAQWTPPASSYLTNNQYTAPAAALGVLSMVVANESGIAPVVANYPGQLINQFKTTFLTEGIFPSGNLGEGIWYHNMSLPVVTMFFAGADTAGLVKVADTRLVKTLTWLSYSTVSPSEYFQYGDAAIDNLKIRAWPQYVFYAAAANQASSWWSWDYLSQNSSITGHNDDIGGKVVYCIYYDSNHVASQLPVAKSYFMPDVANQDTGGIAILRDGFNSNSSVLSLINRDHSHVHQHYDPNSITFSFAGKRLLVDHNANMSFDNPRHGEDTEHNLVIVDEGGAPANDKGWADDVSTYGKIPIFLQDDNMSVAVGDARYPLVDLSKYWNTNGIVADINSVSRAIKAERTVNFFGGLFPRPIIVIRDIYQKDNSNHKYTLLYHVEDGNSLNGNGTLSTPVTVNNGGSGIYLFMGDGKSLSGPESYNETQTGIQKHWKYYSETTGSSAEFTSYIVPFTSAQNEKITGETIQLSGVSGEIVSMIGREEKLIYLRNKNKSQFSVDGVMTDAESVLLGLAGDGSLVSAMFNNASMINLSGNNILSDNSSDRYYVTVKYNQGIVSGRITKNSWNSRDYSFSTAKIILDNYATTPLASPTPVFSASSSCPSGDKGNLNCDSNGTVDLYDLNIFLGNWAPFGPVPTPGVGRYTADINADQKVDIYDLVRLLNNWSNR